MQTRQCFAFPDLFELTNSNVPVVYLSIFHVLDTWTSSPRCRTLPCGPASLLLAWSWPHATLWQHALPALTARVVVRECIALHMGHND